LIFGTGFGGVSDLKTGPDGLLYILSIGDGAIYRIIPV
jgi:aldose sugar dehydrogenase